MKAVVFGASFVLLGALAACGDNGAEPPVPSPDATVIGVEECLAPAAHAPGGSCTADADCDTPGGAGGDGVCLTGDLGGIGWPAAGYCIRIGCTDSSDCGDGNVCVSLEGTRACLPACCTGDTCSDGAVCAHDLLGDNLGGAEACLPGNPTAKDGDACAGFFDCDVHSICNNDPLEFPGGQCQRIDCTEGDDSTCAPSGDGHCVIGLVSASGSFDGCEDTCVNDDDCRTAEGYVCFDGGDAGKFCRHPQAGDTCATDADCGDPATWDCLTGNGFSGGYCTVHGCTENGGGCTLGSSACFDANNDDQNADNFCVDRCNDVEVVPVQSTCRQGYVCTDVDTRINVTVGGCTPGVVIP